MDWRRPWGGGEEGGWPHCFKSVGARCEAEGRTYNPPPVQVTGIPTLSTPDTLRRAQDRLNQNLMENRI
jgi:hypothetical protein